MVKGSKLCASATTRGNDHAGENILQPVQAEQAAGGRRSRSPAPPPRAALFRSSPVTTSVSDPVSQSPLRRARSILLAFPLLALSSLFICQRQGTQVKSPAGLKKKVKSPAAACAIGLGACSCSLPPPVLPRARPRALACSGRHRGVLLLCSPPTSTLSLSSALLNQTGETAPLSPLPSSRSIHPPLLQTISLGVRTPDRGGGGGDGEPGAARRAAAGVAAQEPAGHRRRRLHPRLLRQPPHRARLRHAPHPGAPSLLCYPRSAPLSSLLIFYC